MYESIEKILNVKEYYSSQICPHSSAVLVLNLLAVNQTLMICEEPPSLSSAAHQQQTERKPSAALLCECI